MDPQPHEAANGGSTPSSPPSAPLLPPPPPATPEQQEFRALRAALAAAIKALKDAPVPPMPKPPQGDGGREASSFDVSTLGRAVLAALPPDEAQERAHWAGEGTCAGAGLWIDV